MNHDAIKGRSIRTKIVFSLVGLSLLSLVSVSSIVGFQIHKELKLQATNQLLSIAKQKSVEYNLIFDRLASEAEAVAGIAATQLQRNEKLTPIKYNVLMPWVNKGTGVGAEKGYGSPELSIRHLDEVPKIQRIGKVLMEIKSNNDFISSAYFATTSDIFIGDNQLEKLMKRPGYVPSKRDWYKLAASNRKTSWSEPYIGASSGNLLVTVASPAYSVSNKLLGVVGFDILLTKVKEDILTIDTGFDGYSLLISNNGQALVTPDIAKGNTAWDEQYKTENMLATKNQGWNNVVKEMIKGGFGIEQFDNDGIRYLAYTPVDALNASLGLVVPVKDVVAPAYNILKWIAGIAALVSLFALFVGTFLGNSISKPILEITRLVNEASIGKSDLGTIEHSRKDELGLLTDAFNRLTKSLKIALNMSRRN